MLARPIRNAEARRLEVLDGAVMTKISRYKWERLLNGMSHAVFEVTWAAFPWMKQIWIKNSAGRAHFIVQVAGIQVDARLHHFGAMFQCIIDQFLDGS